MSARRKPSQADIELFRQAVGPVTPLVHDKTDPHRPAPPPEPTFTRKDEVRVLADLLSDDFEPADLETGEELWYVRAGLQRSLLRKLRRGQFAVGAELDLHGHTVVAARGAISQFLHRSSAARIRCVRIIHGKGRGSHQRLPVLKHKVNNWLRQRDEVLAFCSARPVDGGTGAVYVLLRRPR
ncbi:MAG: Smr/MutS family protein [Gammaproteobacteria bacterium]